MQPLNPFLAAFFKSSIPGQCAPVHHHILLVPLTDVLLTSRETDTGSTVTELVTSEDFLASHVLRIPSSAAPSGAKDGAHNLREARGKAKQFNTLNGKSVIIKDSFVYSNKGFKSLAQAQMLNDAAWYPDVFEPRQWLLYFISRPLIGTWEEVKIIPAKLPTNTIKESLDPHLQRSNNGNSTETTGPKKKDIKTFHELLNNFPMIARQMQNGLEKLFVEFSTALQKPLPPPPSTTNTPNNLSSDATQNLLQGRSIHSIGLGNTDTGQSSLPVTGSIYAEDDENILRASLETAVTAAIDLFQSVDKQQLSLLGATTDLTGPLVEKLIERYITENVHHLLFPKLSALKRPEDLELEAKIRQMEFIDVSQLGLALEGGSRAKHDLVVQLGPASEEFKKITTAMSPQEMMDSLLSTIKLVSHLTRASSTSRDPDETSTEKETMTVNADTLVSILLYVVIRSQVRNLQARLMYVRNFIFIEDVDSGELGYALSTFEAVLTYLVMDSAGLRRASKRNRTLWDAAQTANMSKLRSIMEPTDDAIIDDEDAPIPLKSHKRQVSISDSRTNGTREEQAPVVTKQERYSRGSDLNHVFPFQARTDAQGDLSQLLAKQVKRVAMDTRSMSSSSEISYHSRSGSFASMSSVLQGDVSVERLSQTNDAFGESLLMMSVQHEQFEALAYLLSLTAYYTLQFVLDDMNNENTTLLSAAIQLGNVSMIGIILNRITSSTSTDEFRRYLLRQDIWGRSAGHYLFNSPSLIDQLGPLIDWKQRDKNGQTPLFALCRSYDHRNYRAMVEAGLRAARVAQRDDGRLHVDDHVDGRGNTLLHIINDPTLVNSILQLCDVDVNATNERRFTALMLASKYGRYEMVRVLFTDPRVDVAARETRGLTAVELAKDDDVRNKIDDLALFSMLPGPDGRITGVVRTFFVEDGSVRMVLKSAAPTDRESYTVTTSRRSLSDFEHLVRLLEMEHPASWIPPMSDNRSPFQIPTRPSRAILRDMQSKSDGFLKVMLSHPTFATHEMMWEFFLVPELQLNTMEQRTKLKVATRSENIREEYEPVENIREIEEFVNHAKDMVRTVNYSNKSVARRVNNVGLAASDMYDSSVLLHRGVSTLHFLPRGYIIGFETYVRSMSPTQSSPQATLHTSLLAIQSTVQAILSALARPSNIVDQIGAAKREAERNQSTASRTSRWPLGLLDDTRQRMHEEREERARRSREEATYLSRELRYTQQTVASELAGWQSMHEKMGRQAITDFVRGMVVMEKAKLDGMMRALRKVRNGNPQEEREGEGLRTASSLGSPATLLPTDRAA